MSTLHFKIPTTPVNTNSGENDNKFTRGQLNRNPNAFTKVCYICRNEKPLHEFSGNKTRTDGKQTYCKQCGKEQQSKWYYSRKYGITLETRDNLLKAQNGKCAICGINTTFKLKAGAGSNIGEEAIVDHCHTSKKIRGVLCGACNVGLGSFKDNVNSLKSAISYLSNSV